MVGWSEGLGGHAAPHAADRHGTEPGPYDRQRDAGPYERINPAAGRAVG